MYVSTEQMFNRLTILNGSDDSDNVQRNSTCSAAFGSLFRIACAALLFLVVIAAAKGVNPALSLIVRSSPG